MNENEKNPAGRASGAAAPSTRTGYRARIERIFDHADDVRSLFLRNLGSTLPPFSPGMFISVAIPLEGGERLRPYTLASSPEALEPFEIVFNRVSNGAGTAWLFARKTGEELNYTGPYGLFTLTAAPDVDLVFIAENTAIAPLRPMIKRALASGSQRRIDLVYAADRPDHLLYVSELRELARDHPRFHLTTLIVEGGASPLYARLVQEVRDRWVKEDADRSAHFYVCGVGDGVIELRDRLRQAGYERRAVHYEKW